MRVFDGEITLSNPLGCKLAIYCECDRYGFGRPLPERQGAGRHTDDLPERKQPPHLG